MVTKRVRSIGMFDEVSVVMPNVPDHFRPGISKSKFVAGVQCLKRLYWQVYDPELEAEPGAANYMALEQGREVGRLARQLFPGGVEVEASRENLQDAVRITKELIANRSVPAIFEATFEQNGVLVRVDILQRRDKNRWCLLEVKSTADLKDYHLYDVGIQSRVVARSGIKLSSSNLIHLNRDYVFQGGSFDLKQLFRVRQLNRQLGKLQRDLTRQLRTEFRILQQSEPPDIAPGQQCREPVLCEFFDSCNPAYPPDHVTCLPRVTTRTIDELKAMGIETIVAIPEGFPLSERQSRACFSVKTGQLWCGPELGQQLRTLKYPLCFMDFETVNPALPRFAGMRPFDYLPFQWSVHRQNTPTEAPEHFEFLADDDGDPRLAFVQSLLKAIQGAATIVVYYGQFESGRLSELAEWLPQYRKQIGHVQKKIWDLLPVVRDNVYHRDFRGSFSLKRVLPALVPEMSYEGMEVSDGAEAGLAWEKMRSLAEESTARNETRTALLAYCGQDTFAMVRLVDILRSLANAHARKAVAP
jgi:hypothetical protein